MKNKITHPMTRLFAMIFAVSITGYLLAGCSLMGGTATPEPVAPLEQTNVEDFTVVAEGNLVPNDFDYLTFARGGRVAEILVSKGDTVVEGQVLARIADREQAEASLAGAELEHLSAQQAYDELIRTAELARSAAWLELIRAKESLQNSQQQWDEIDTENFRSQVDDAELAVTNANEDVQDAQEEFDKYQNLDEDNPSRQRAEDELENAEDRLRDAERKRDDLINQRDTARAALDQAQAALVEAQRKYDLTANGPDTEKLALAEARLKNSQAQLTAAQAGLDYLELKAPYAGTIVDVNISANQQVGTERWAFLIADFSAWFVETNDLTELEVVRIVEGQSADLVADALPEVQLFGVVEEISQSFTTQAGDILYKVRIKVDEIDPQMRWGMTFEVTFIPED